MRTIVIWDSGQLFPIKFCILDGDYRHLDGVYIYSLKNKEKQKELTSIIQPKKESDFLDKFPLPLQEEDAVIVAGYVRIIHF